jgi:hypothetical protein
MQVRRIDGNDSVRFDNKKIHDSNVSKRKLKRQSHNFDMIFITVNNSNNRMFRDRNNYIIIIIYSQ